MAKLSAITFDRLKTEVESYLQGEYNKASMLFGVSSPYGQILSVIENLHQLSILYLKNTISQFDLISTANSNNERVIRNTAILAGHIPTRAISATGTLRFVRKAGIDLDKELPSGIVTLTNRLTLKNKTNSLNYSLDLGKFKMDLDVRTTSKFPVSIIQGKWLRKVFTGSGSPMQTYQINQSENRIENFNYEVSVNGVLWTIKTHVYDMLPDEEACIVRTGFNGGIDVIFGNGGFGKIPPISSEIVVRFLDTSGSLGNVYRRDLNDWKFIDDVYDTNGNVVDLENIFDIEIYNDINFGADEESFLFTKSLLPIASNNFVLALPQQYAYELKKLGVFTHVNADEKNGTIFIYLVPDINLFKRQGEDYFSIPIKNTSVGSITTTSAFELDSYERSKIVNFLKSSGHIQLTKKFIIKSPKLSFYAMNVWVISYSDITDDSVKSQVVAAVSNYFLNLNKFDRIAKSEMISLLSGISDIHSVKIEFVCRKNEEYHIEGLKSLTGFGTFNASKFFSDPSLATTSYDPNKVLGLDPQLGDILFEADELPIMRGGWYDRNSTFYTDESPSKSSSLSSVNVFITGKVDSKNRNM